MIKPRRSLRRRMTAGAFPSVQPDVMMIAARRQKSGRRSGALRQFKPKHIAIEPECSLQVRHLQMYVTNSSRGMYRIRRHEPMSCSDPRSSNWRRHCPPETPNETGIGGNSRSHFGRYLIGFQDLLRIACGAQKSHPRAMCSLKAVRRGSRENLL